MHTDWKRVESFGCLTIRSTNDEQLATNFFAQNEFTQATQITDLYIYKYIYIYMYVSNCLRVKFYLRPDGWQICGILGFLGIQMSMSTAICGGLTYLLLAMPRRTDEWHWLGSAQDQQRWQHHRQRLLLPPRQKRRVRCVSHWSPLHHPAGPGWRLWARS